MVGEITLYTLPRGWHSICEFCLGDEAKRGAVFWVVSLSELMELFVAGRDQSAADQPNNLAEGHPPL